MLGDAVKVVIVEFKGPLISIRNFLTYQTYITYPLAPPSSYIGAIAKSLAYLGLCTGQSDCIKSAVELIRKARSVSTRVSRSPVLLRVFRAERGESDVFIKEFSFFNVNRALFIPKDENRIDELIKAIKIIDRLGNSESLVTVVNVKVLDAVPCNNAGVNVVVKAEVARDGNYVTAIASDEDCREVFAFSIKCRESVFAFPVKESKGLYEPGIINVNRRVYCADDVVFPEGDDW